MYAKDSQSSRRCFSKRSFAARTINLAVLWVFASPLFIANVADAITVPVTIRDFRADHPDFESQIGWDNEIVLPQLGSDGKPQYAGNPTTGSTSGAENFYQWYNDVPGVNTTENITIDLVDQGGGVYVYNNDAFFPIDGLGFGNEGNSHNFHFTTEVHLFFTYSGGEVFEFEGDDDLFVFMNNRLVLDLGGVHPPQAGAVSLDEIANEIGLQIGGTYALDLFHAERHTVQSTFRLTTTIDVKLDPEGGLPPPPPPPPPPGQSDAGPADDDAGQVEPGMDAGVEPAPGDDDGFWEFPDLDGDGLPDECSLDVESGIQCEGTELPDLDGDGIPDVVDDDRDGDGIADNEDEDLDGDGIPNTEDDDLDGDGVPNNVDFDVDGDGAPNDADRDIDGDGQANGTDSDVDGDGIPNQDDPDVDGDGIENEEDIDADGDGIPNDGDITPTGPASASPNDGGGDAGAGGGNANGCGCRMDRNANGVSGIFFGLLAWGAWRRRRS